MDAQENATMTEQEKPDFTVVDRRQGAPSEANPPSEAPMSPTAADPVATSDFSAPAETASAGSGGSEPETGEDPFGLPDPALLVAMAAMQTTPQELMGLLAPAFDSQARRALGLIADTQTGELSPNMDAAKAAIDAVQFCLSRAEPILDAAEHREMLRRLNDLRLTFVAKQHST